MKNGLWVLLPGFHAGNLAHFSPHNYWGILMGFQLMVTDGLPDGSTDESDNVWMEGKLPRY